MSALAEVVWVVSRISIFTVVVYVFVSYFLDRFHPVRLKMEVILEPMLGRIRPILPNTGAFDFSPVILILIIELIARALVGLLS